MPKDYDLCACCGFVLPIDELEQMEIGGLTYKVCPHCADYLEEVYGSSYYRQYS